YDSGPGFAPGLQCDGWVQCSEPPPPGSDVLLSRCHRPRRFGQARCLVPVPVSRPPAPRGTPVARQSWLLVSSSSWLSSVDLRRPVSTVPKQPVPRHPVSNPKHERPATTPG